MAIGIRTTLHKIVFDLLLVYGPVLFRFDPKVPLQVSLSVLRVEGVPMTCASSGTQSYRTYPVSYNSAMEMTQPSFRCFAMAG
jgi:hypothetical protein